MGPSVLLVGPLRGSTSCWGNDFSKGPLSQGAHQEHETVGVELYDNQQQLAKAHMAMEDLQQALRTEHEGLTECEGSVSRTKALLMQAQGASQEEEKRVRTIKPAFTVRKMAHS